MGATDESVRRAARVLTAFMTEAEANGYASSYAIDPAAFIATWRAQETARTLLPPACPTPRIEDIPPSMLAHVVSVRAHAAYQPAYGDAEIQLVELGKLIAFQHWMDIDVSQGVHGAGLEGPPTEQHLLDACLPPTIVSPAKVFALPAASGLAVYSTNNTFRAAGPIVDMAKGEIKFVLTTNPNLMLVREYERRYVLANGYHRAWWLRSRGVEMVPAVVAHAKTVSDLVPEAGFVSPQILTGPRPPTIEDFFDDALSVTVQVRATLRQVKVCAETLTVPRLL